MPEAMNFNPFEQDVFRTAALREGKHDAPSQPGDLDLVTYSLRKWMRLALKGNPTILTLLFAPRATWVDGEGLWQHVQFLTPKIVSKQAGKAFLGYLQAQRMRMTGERGGSHGAVHSEDREKFGYDTKYAMHMLRLGYQGIELLSSGSMSMPMSPDTRETLLAVRRGESSYNDVLTRCGELERELRDLLDGTSPLPDRPDSDYMEKWMIQTYWSSWLGSYDSIGWSLADELDFKGPELGDEFHKWRRERVETKA
jgi:hypothetical protein